MSGIYYGRAQADTLLEQRGQTAVLGLGAPSLGSQDALGNDSVQPDRTAPRTASLLASAGGTKPARGIGRRKLRRSENARLSSNPHVVRPSGRDFALPHNDRHSSFPLPPELQKIYAASMGEERRAGEPSGSNPASHQGGPFTISYSDAHFFLTQRCGVRPRGLEAAAAGAPGDDGNAGADGEDLGAVQRFIRQAEKLLAAWIQQDVFMDPNGPSSSAAIAGDESPLIDLRSLQTGMGDARDLRLFEVARNPHNLVLSVPDPFMRLAIHCLSRILACPSFSKDGPRDADKVHARQTWILKGRCYGVTRRRPTASNLEGSIASLAAPSDLETPPATDPGSDAGQSDLDAASDVGSDWVVSDIGEDADEDWQTAVDGSRLSAGDTTVGNESSAAQPYVIREDREDWADAEESDGG